MSYGTGMKINTAPQMAADGRRRYRETTTCSGAGIERFFKFSKTRTQLTNRCAVVQLNYIQARVMRKII